MKKVYVLPLLFFYLFATITLPAQPDSPETGFGGGTGKVITSINTGDDIVTGMVVQPNGKVILAGYTNASGKINPAIIRYNTDGTTDNSFGVSGIVTFDTLSTGADAALGVTLQNDGKVLVSGVADYSGAAYDGFVLRLQSDGSPDNTFGSDGVARTGTAAFPSVIKVQAGGKIIIAGIAPVSGSDDYFVARFNGSDGSMDGTFGTAGIVTTEGAAATDDVLFGMAFQSNGSIIISGYSKSTAGGSDNDFVLIRLDGSDGSLDGSFGAGGKVVTDIGTDTEDHAYGVAVDGNDDIFVTGFTTNTNRDVVTAKFSGVDGSIVTTFGVNGYIILDVTGDDEGKAVAIQNDGKLVVAFTSGGAINAIRYNTTDGSVDASFGTAGIATVSGITVNAEELLAIQLQHTRIHIGGTHGVASVDDFAVAVLLNDASALPVTLLQFIAQKQNNAIALQWQTEKEEGITQYIIERSKDGKNFSAIGYLAPAKTGALRKNYSFYDYQPLTSVNYYRLAIKEVDESFLYSKILAIKFNKATSASLEIFPNPVLNNWLRLQLPDGLTGNLNIQVTDAAGRIVKTMRLQAGGGSSIATSLDVSSLQKGVYFIQLQGGSSTTITRQFLKN